MLALALVWLLANMAFYFFSVWAPQMIRELRVLDDRQLYLLLLLSTLWQLPALWAAVRVTDAKGAPAALVHFLLCGALALALFALATHRPEYCRRILALQRE